MDDPTLFGPGGWGGYHPSLSEVLDREAEISAWRLNKWWYEMCVRLRTIGTVLFAFLALVVGLAGSIGFTLVMLCLLMAVRSWHPKEPLMCPRTLSLVPFSKWENENLLRIQEWYDFEAWCQCPSCGFVDAHQLRDRSEPWAEAVRVCRMCNRQWAQS